MKSKRFSKKQFFELLESMKDPVLSPIEKGPSPVRFGMMIEDRRKPKSRITTEFVRITITVTTNLSKLKAFEARRYKLESKYTNWLNEFTKNKENKA